MADGVSVDPDDVDGFAKKVWHVGDKIAALRMDSVLLQGAGACEGTALMSSLREHAFEQQDHVTALAQKHDQLVDELKYTAEDFRRTDSGSAGRLDDVGNQL
ncbi:Uncharacterised protein [Mycobacteroides abscessus subsp. bolletii]|uniref:type VII secretion target n=1 Tax=Mycobacteroides abscessus TaxID=36809 RepID=UPI00092B3EE6|nr:type VII secretion target [Mycobacteroides abscessus]SHP16253.1 Uncharacterised protein [Mycobacteroides abscessus subsp. bolletii]SHR30910.1 Uncharacterised protein [Mycobacteroides abscessus subsp. bolletii]SHR83305.1 Uncharacterised protein [Mycobacteroides abscessus subsp. bolletii]SHS42939.1 Uncharacterised protein [Mycobacteroides abscessus subsp. bolletii]SHX31370.1 Uncharacterised protein [Mycobacteroides abscessus subsp. bolletii]